MELTNEIATILVIGLVVALIIEGLKHSRLNEHLTGLMVDLLTLALGLVGGLIAMYIFKGPYAEYVGIGFLGAIASTKIYEIIKNLGGRKYTKKVGE